MKIHYFCTHWGNQLAFPKFCKNVVNAGYNGVEMDLPLVKKKRNEIVETLADHGLLLIGQYWQSLEKDFNLNEKNFKKHLYNLAEANPVMINTQTGKDYFSFAQNMQLFIAAKTIAAETGIEIVHETHRGKFLFNLQVFEAAAKAAPDLGIALDISHWCTVHESLLQDQQEAVQLALQHARHIHLRLGFEEGPQINDPKAPEWKPLLKQYFKWWDVVVAHHKKKKQDLSVTPEFGPAPYMPLKPYSQKPISKQWDNNVFMMKLFKQRYQ